MTSWWRHDDKRNLNIRSDEEFDPSEKLSLGYFSITAANMEQITTG